MRSLRADCRAKEQNVTCHSSTSKQVAGICWACHGLSVIYVTFTVQVYQPSTTKRLCHLSRCWLEAFSAGLCCPWSRGPFVFVIGLTQTQFNTRQNNTPPATSTLRWFWHPSAFRIVQYECQQRFQRLNLSAQCASWKGCSSSEQASQATRFRACQESLSALAAQLGWQ